MQIIAGVFYYPIPGRKQEMMEAKRSDEFHRFGSHFYAGVSFDYIEKAQKLVAEKGYKVKRELLHLPVYVIEVE